MLVGQARLGRFDMPKNIFSNLSQFIKTDVAFVKSHTLQPTWYKAGKIFIIFGVLAVLYILFGLKRLIAFLLPFLVFSFLLHMMYRWKTKTWNRSWADFKVEDIRGQIKAKRIGWLYYLLLFINAVVSFVLSALA